VARETAQVRSSAVASPEDLYVEPRHVKSVDDCHFYHVMEIPGHGVVGEQWDLRGGERAYLGDVPLQGKRVLEIGPASGFLTFHMERQGAEVVAVELAPDADWDIVPHAGLDLDDVIRKRRPIMERVRNGFWFAHERHRSAARVHYGSAYDLPAALGHFDVAVLGSVLLHTRDPLRIVEGCARHSDTIVITEAHDKSLDGDPLARLVPRPASAEWDTWWYVSPELFVSFLGVLGFTDSAVTFHAQRFIGGEGSVDLPLFTVVARRT
jgi:SAM-dependent methyltransferase